MGDAAGTGGNDENGNGKSAGNDVLPNNGGQLPRGPHTTTPPETGEDARGNAVVTDPWWKRRALWLRRWATGESRVDVLAEEIALGWRENRPEIRDLLMSLEAKWQASREEARSAAVTAAFSFVGGILALILAVLALYDGRSHSSSLITHLLQQTERAAELDRDLRVHAIATAPTSMVPPPPTLPSVVLPAPSVIAPTPAPTVQLPTVGSPTPPAYDRALVWQALIVTSGSVLLLVGIATLLLRTADRYAQRGRQHAGDADATRRIETAVRLTMAYGQVKVHGEVADKVVLAEMKSAENFNKVAIKLLEGSNGKEPKSEELSALPDALKQLAEAVGALKKTIPGAGSD